MMPFFAAKKNDTRQNNSCVQRAKGYSYSSAGAVPPAAEKTGAAPLSLTILSLVLMEKHEKNLPDNHCILDILSVRLFFRS